MNIPITKRWTLQVIWRGDGHQRPWFGCAAWPWMSSRPPTRRPLFYSLCIFWLELRWFDCWWPARGEAEGEG